MVWKSEKGEGLLVDDFEAVMPNVRNARFRILADDDPGGDVPSAVVRTVFRHW
jgi:hypothetical protein